MLQVAKTVIQLFIEVMMKKWKWLRHLLSVLYPFNLLKSAICPQLLLRLFCRVLLTLQCICLFDCVVFAAHALHYIVFYLSVAGMEVLFTPRRWQPPQPEVLYFGGCVFIPTCECDISLAVWHNWSKCKDGQCDMPRSSEHVIWETPGDYTTVQKSWFTLHFFLFC